MAISPAPGRRLTRWVLRVLLLAAAMLAIATPAFAAGHAANHDRSAHKLPERTGWLPPRPPSPPA